MRCRNMPTKHRKDKNRIRLELERLEDRTVPAIISVSNVSELRAAITAANNFDIIQMAGGGYFTQGSPVDASNLTKNLTLRAAGAGVIMDGGLVGDMFRISNPSGNPGTAIQ